MGSFTLCLGKPAMLPPSAAECSFCLAGGSSVGPVLNLGHQILFPVLGHLPCPLSQFLAPSTCGRNKNRLSPLAFQAGMNKKTTTQRSEVEKGKETIPRSASKPTQSRGAAAALFLSKGWEGHPWWPGWPWESLNLAVPVFSVLILLSAPSLRPPAPFCPFPSSPPSCRCCFSCRLTVGVLAEGRRRTEQGVCGLRVTQGEAL